MAGLTSRGVSPSAFWWLAAFVLLTRSWERALGEAAADAVGSEPPVVLWIIGGPGRTSGKGLTHRAPTVLILSVLGKPR